MLNNPTEQQDKEKLISRCKAGDRQALNLLYCHYRPYLLNICKHYAKEDHVAEDLLHDAFIVILTSLDKLRDTDKLEAWMTTIVRNVGYHYWKHLDKEHTALKQMAGESQDMTAGSLMPDYELMQKLLAQLPKGYQQVFRLFLAILHQFQSLADTHKVRIVVVDENGTLQLSDEIIELALGANDTFERSETQQMRLSHISDDAEIRQNNLHKRLDFPWMVSPHLNDSNIMLLRQLQQSLRHSDVVVEVTLCVKHVVFLLQH